MNQQEPGMTSGEKGTGSLQILLLPKKGKGIAKCKM